jgi:hypothetical protein
LACGTALEEPPRATYSVTVGGITITNISMVTIAGVQQAGNEYKNAHYIGSDVIRSNNVYYKDTDSIAEQTTIDLNVGAKLMFRARKGTGDTVSYDPDGNGYLDEIYGSNASGITNTNYYGTKYMDPMVAFMNANSQNDDTTGSDVDTFVIIQKIG